MLREAIVDEVREARLYEETPLVNYLQDFIF